MDKDNKKSMSPVVATALLLVIAVCVVVGFNKLSEHYFDEVNENPLNTSNTLLDNSTNITNLSDSEILTQMLVRIKNNCGSDYITTKYGDNNYYVFAKTCIHDDYCKYEYLSLEECLK